MPNPIEFETERLFMRQWRPSDRAPFAELNADPRVMDYFLLRSSATRAMRWPIAARR